MLIKVHVEPFRYSGDKDRGIQWVAKMRLPEEPHRELKAYGDNSVEAQFALQQIYKSWRATKDDAQNLRDQGKDIEVNW